MYVSFALNIIKTRKVGGITLVKNGRLQELDKIFLFGKKHSGVFNVDCKFIYTLNLNLEIWKWQNYLSGIEPAYNYRRESKIERNSTTYIRKCGLYSIQPQRTLSSYKESDSLAFYLKTVVPKTKKVTNAVSKIEDPIVAKALPWVDPDKKYINRPNSLISQPKKEITTK